MCRAYLTRAECNFRLGSTVGASPLDDITAIRSRVGLATPASYITLANIIMERKLELAHEGQAIQDVKRLKESVDNFDYDANELVFPIPRSEVDASKGMLIWYFVAVFSHHYYTLSLQVIIHIFCYFALCNINSDHVFL